MGWVVRLSVLMALIATRLLNDHLNAVLTQRGCTLYLITPSRYFIIVMNMVRFYSQLPLERSVMRRLHDLISSCSVPAAPSA